MTRPGLAPLSALRGNLQHLGTTLQSLLLNPGQGQAFTAERRELHALNERRAWMDIMVLPSHAPMLASSWCSLSNGVVELGLLSFVTLVLSVLYHRRFEAPGKLCTAEGITAKILFVYGVLQMPRAPSLMLFRAELLCAVGTAAFFVVTNAWKKLYDSFHPLGLHIIPAVWCAIVGLNHAPFFF